LPKPALGNPRFAYVVRRIYFTQGVAKWRFKADAANKGRVMDRGLWVLTVLSPLAMAFFLIVVTGGRLLEKDMAKRPGHPECQRRTSFFLPRPPR
jgi:steroid 5-alpha reductase family enzyme